MSLKKACLVTSSDLIASDVQLCLKKHDYTTFAKANSLDGLLQHGNLAEANVLIVELDPKEGVKFRNTLKDIRSQFNLPLILVVHNAKEQTRNAAILCGAQGILLYPFREGDFTYTLDLVKNETVKLQQIKPLISDSTLFHYNSTGTVDAFFIKHKSRYKKIAADEILYIEALKDYVVINTANQRYTIHSTMKDLERRLPKPQFQRVHRSFIVQLNRIMHLDYSEIELDGAGKPIPIGGSYRDELQSELRFL